MDRKQYGGALHYAYRSYDSRESIGLQFVQPYSLLLIGDIFKFTEGHATAMKKIAELPHH